MRKITKRTHGSTNVKFTLTALTAIIASITGDIVLAQEPVEEIQVTGSRIGRSGMSAPTPVTAISQDEMQVLSPTTLMGALDMLPQFQGSATLDDTVSLLGGGYLGSGGQSNLNLRSVGANRTLVLLNGRRIVPSNRNSTIDISLFPQALIQRTEVVTGGASAAYGSDAITGVTNFIMNTDFEGVDVNVQAGVSELGDAENYRASFATGLDVGERGHFIFGIEGYQSAEISNLHDRDWYKSWADYDYGEGVRPRRVRVENNRTRASTFGGLITRGPLAGTQFVGDGRAVPFEDGTLLNPAAITGKNQKTAANPNGIYTGSQVGGSGDQFDVSQMQRAELERVSVYTNYKYDLTENITASLQGVFGYSYVDNQKVGYDMSTTWAMTIYRENPFLPADVVQRMQAANVTNFRLDRRASMEDPLMNSRAPLTTDVYSITGSLEGTFSNDWDWSVYAQRGISNRDVDIYGFRIDRMFRGIDSIRNPTTGAPMCASTLIEPNDGCIPINIFGVGNVSKEGMAWLHEKMYTDARITQSSAEFVTDGELFEGWGAGPILMAVGANWRRDQVNQLSGDSLHGAPVPANGEGLVSSFNAQGVRLYRGLPTAYEKGSPVIDRVGAASFKGGFDVAEIFAENIIPVVRDLPFMQGLDATIAARYTDYEVSGEVWAWKVGFDWQIVDDLRFRLTRSQDIRAGNLSEMFDTTSLFNFFTNPWKPDAADTTLIGISLNGGNPAVNPEEADTITYGFVYEPSWLDGAGFSVDYYDIKIDGRISAIGAQNIVDFCYEEGAFCDQITFAPNGDIAIVDNTSLNVGASRDRGMDLEFTYRTDVSFFDKDESLSFRAIGSRIFESSTTPYGATEPLQQAGVGTRQYWNATFTGTYNIGRASASFTTRWVDEAMRSRTWVTGIDVDDNTIPSHALSNLRLSYGLDIGEATSSIYLSVNNLFDRNPGDIEGLTGIYDVVGRNYTLGANYRF
ncbi:MAG: TonB-dependent receptor [Pseudomonadota bacterium]